MDVQEEYFENARPFLQKLQSFYVSIRLLENFSVKVLVEAEKNTLKVFCNVYKAHLPLSLGLLQYQAIYPLFSKPSWDKRITIATNRHVLLIKMQYNDSSSHDKAQMVKQHYDNIMSDIKELTNKLLNYLDFKKYVSSSRISTFNKIISMIAQSSFRQLSQYDVNLYLEKYCAQAQKASKTNTQMLYNRCFQTKQIQQIQRIGKTIILQRQNKIISKQNFFPLKNVIYLESQKYEIYADNFLWKIKVFFNLCVQCKINDFSLNQVLLKVNELGQIKIDKSSSKEQTDYDSLKHSKRIKNSSKRKSFEIARIMYVLFVGQFPQSLDQNKYFEPTIGLIDQWKKQPVHQCLWKIFTKCFNGDFNNNNYEVADENIPHLDWIISILKTILVEVYEQQ